MAFSNEKVLLFLAANADRNDKLFIDYEEIIHPTYSDVALLHVIFNALLAQIADLRLDPNENPSVEFYRERFEHVLKYNGKLFPNIRTASEMTNEEIGQLFDKLAILFG